MSDKNEHPIIENTATPSTAKPPAKKKGKPKSRPEHWLEEGATIDELTHSVENSFMILRGFLDRQQTKNVTVTAIEQSEQIPAIEGNDTTANAMSVMPPPVESIQPAPDTIPPEAANNSVDPASLVNGDDALPEATIEDQSFEMPVLDEAVPSEITESFDESSPASVIPEEGLGLQPWLLDALPEDSMPDDAGQRESTLWPDEEDAEQADREVAAEDNQPNTDIDLYNEDQYSSLPVAPAESPAKFETTEIDLEVLIEEMQQLREHVNNLNEPFPADQPEPSVTVVEDQPESTLQETTVDQSESEVESLSSEPGLEASSSLMAEEPTPDTPLPDLFAQRGWLADVADDSNLPTDDFLADNDLVALPNNDVPEESLNAESDDRLANLAEVPETRQATDDDDPPLDLFAKAKWMTEEAVDQTVSDNLDQPQEADLQPDVVWPIERLAQGDTDPVSDQPTNQGLLHSDDAISSSEESPDGLPDLLAERPWLAETDDPSDSVFVGDSLETDLPAQNTVEPETLPEFFVEREWLIGADVDDTPDAETKSGSDTVPVSEPAPESVFVGDTAFPSLTEADMVEGVSNSDLVDLDESSVPADFPPERDWLSELEIEPPAGQSRSSLGNLKTESDIFATRDWLPEPELFEDALTDDESHLFETPDSLTLDAQDAELPLIENEPLTEESETDDTPSPVDFMIDRDWLSDIDVDSYVAETSMQADTLAWLKDAGSGSRDTPENMPDLSAEFVNWVEDNLNDHQIVEPDLVEPDSHDQHPLTHLEPTLTDLITIIDQQMRYAYGNDGLMPVGNVPDIETISFEEISPAQVADKGSEAPVDDGISPLVQESDDTISNTGLPKPGPQEGDTQDETASDEAPLRQYLVFTLNQTHYAVPAANIREISDLSQITTVPNVPYWLEGVTNLRGDILSLVDLRAFFKMPRAVYNAERQVLVAHSEAGFSPILTGLIVDAVQEIQYLADTDIQPPSDAVVAELEPYILGVSYSQPDGFWLLDLDRLLNSPKMRCFEL